MSTPTGFRSLATVDVFADDVATAAAWYTEIFGIEPYFSRPGPTGAPAYVEFRVGDALDEFGIIDRAFAPASAVSGPGGAIVHWLVEDVDASYAALLAAGATAFMSPTDRGEGFRPASAIDPFGNLVGVMANPHVAARFPDAARGETA